MPQSPESRETGLRKMSRWECELNHDIRDARPCGTCDHCWARKWARQQLAALPPGQIPAIDEGRAPLTDADRRAIVTGGSRGEKAAGMFGGAV